MKKFVFAAASLLYAFYPGTVFAREPVPFILSGDGEFLGLVINDNFNDQSICNNFGNYGSKFEDSIFNKFGDYGNNFSETSAYNPRARKPPLLIVNNEVAAIITKNRNFGRARIDPDVLVRMNCGK